MPGTCDPLAAQEGGVGERRRLYVGGLAGFALAILIVAVFWWFWCSTTTLLVVRHADRAGSLDQLTPEGEVRAEALAHVVAKAGLAAIYTSDTNRTRRTAAPAATAQGLTAIEMPAADVTGLVSHVFANHRGRTVLVVGHSNTVPQIIAAAGGPSLPDIAGNEFDNLFTVSVCRCWWRRVRVTNLQYGAPSP
jgi:broad specificity phosphatase PhoE